MNFIKSNGTPVWSDISNNAHLFFLHFARALFTSRMTKNFIPFLRYRRRGSHTRAYLYKLKKVSVVTVSQSLLHSHLLVTTTGNPSDGLRMISGSAMLASWGTEERIEYRRKNHDNTVFSSSIANFWPGEVHWRLLRKVSRQREFYLCNF